MTPLAAVGWSALFFVLGPAAVGVTAALRPGAEADIVNQGACIVLAASVTMFAIVRVHAPESSLRATLGLRPIGPLQGLLSAVVGVGLVPSLSAVTERIVDRWPYSDEERQMFDLLYRTPTTAARVALVLVAVVVIPAALELFFRGALFGELARAASLRVALAVSAFCFAASQGDPRAFPSALVLGLALARLRAKTGSVVAPLLGTLAFGAVEAVPILRGADPAANIVVPLRWVVAGACVAVLALAVVGGGQKRRPPA